jgi:hypothetical protein
MGEVYESLEDPLRDFIARQHVFFVATAPLASDGLLNLSPKGLDTLKVLGPRTVAYLDLTGSGIETIAHLKENGRIVLMFCAFDGPPKILRLHGRGEVLEPGCADYADLLAEFPPRFGARAIVRVEVGRISDSCGYAVPLLDYQGEREALDKWAEKKGPEGIVRYWREKNEASLDGLPGIKR